MAWLPSSSLLLLLLFGASAVVAGWLVGLFLFILPFLRLLMTDDVVIYCTVAVATTTTAAVAVACFDVLPSSPLSPFLPEKQTHSYAEEKPPAYPCPWPAYTALSLLSCDSAPYDEGAWFMREREREREREGEKVRVMNKGGHTHKVWRLSLIHI